VQLDSVAENRAHARQHGARVQQELEALVLLEQLAEQAVRVRHEGLGGLALLLERLGERGGVLGLFLLERRVHRRAQDLDLLRRDGVLHDEISVLHEEGHLGLQLRAEQRVERVRQQRPLRHDGRPKPLLSAGALALHS